MKISAKMNFGYAALNALGCAVFVSHTMRSIEAGNENIAIFSIACAVITGVCAVGNVAIGAFKLKNSRNNSPTPPKYGR